MALVSLTTNLSYTDYYLGALKGAILKTNPSVQLVDAAIGLPNFDYKHTATVLRNFYPFFPENTIHLVHQNKTDIDSQLIVCQHHQQYFIGFNNGLLPLAFGEIPAETYVVAFQKTRFDAIFAKEFSMVIKAIIDGQPLATFGSKDKIEYYQMPKIIINPQIIKGQVEYIDNFQNIITNITKEDVLNAFGDAPFTLYFRSYKVTDLSTTYNDVKEGDSVIFFNLENKLEIAMNQGKAAELMGGRMTQAVILEKNENK